VVYQNFIDWGYFFKVEQQQLVVAPGVVLLLKVEGGKSQGAPCSPSSKF
jgi:hypothetical protein